MEKRKIIRVEVWPRQDGTHAPKSGWIGTAAQQGIQTLTGCRMTRLFFLYGLVTPAQIERISRELLADPVTEDFAYSSIDRIAAPFQADHAIEVTPLPGVTDPAAENLLRASHSLGITSLDRAATGQRYLLDGSLSPDTLHTLARSVFSNPVIQCFDVDRPTTPPFAPDAAADATVETIAVRDTDPGQLLKISAERCLALDLDEMLAVQTYFDGEKRDPTDVELEMIAQTWSEHCVHKTFRAAISYYGPPPGADAHAVPQPQAVDGLLKTYIRGATERINKPWVRSAFVDNAGIVAFDDHWDIAFKLETHNHPSALEPFGGANTGVGGVVRDILGVSARPIANTDVLCFGPKDLPEDRLPAGTLHPRSIEQGVVRGIEDYGNKMGIPTVNGAILYHPGYTSNPLVFCGCLGILPRGSHPSTPQPGDLVVVLGGRTGRDGLHGATFSSMEMDQTTGETSGSAVQIGDPIKEKQVQEVVLRARDEQLYSAITDCGAGGLSSAIGEMGATIGATIHLDAVPLKYPGLRPWEIWLSEAQERMVLAVPSGSWARLQEICKGQDVEAVCLGTLEPTGRFLLYYGEQVVADLCTSFVHNGIPRRRLEAVWEPPQPELFSAAEPGDLTPYLLGLLAHPNIASKEAVVRRYDHEVQGGTVVKPLVGVADHGPGDAAVLIPLDYQIEPSSTKGRWPQGVALSVGVYPTYTDHDPYAMAWAAVDEALRNIVAVGGDPDHVALLDNFCWGNPLLPDRLGSLVRCTQGCYDAALSYGAPFISGKDSLNNEYADANGQRHTIPGTLLISALAMVPDISRAVTMDFKQAGDRIYAVGVTRDELAGTQYALLRDAWGGIVPQPVLDGSAHMRALHQAIQQGSVLACHDCSEGGLGVALAEMCLAGRLGAAIDLKQAPGADKVERDDALLFAESMSRFVVEVSEAQAETFEAALAGVPHAYIGHVEENAHGLRIHMQHTTALHIAVETLERAWRGDLPGPQTAKPIAQTRQYTSPRHSAGTNQKRVLVLHANGTNRDREAALACQLAGAEAEIVHVNQLLNGQRQLLDYHMLVIPGGFSHGDDLGAGTLWALDLRHRLADDMTRFVASGRPVLGICNGFQTLVKTGLLPGGAFSDNGNRTVTLANNASGRFECRWVYLQPNPASSCLFTEKLTEPIYCPAAHGEGRLAVRDEDTLTALQQQNLGVLTYVNLNGAPAEYPGNPNGSVLGLAGLCNPQGNVMGLMPHPEDHVFPWQHPRWRRGESGYLGLGLFSNGIKHA